MDTDRRSGRQPISKLIAWRLRDRDDIRSIIEAGADLDHGYLDDWIEAWDLADRWSAFDFR